MLFRAAICGILAGFPFDSVKTRMQAARYTSMASCIRHTYANEGLRGFYRGIIPPLLTVSVMRALSFSLYERGKGYLLPLVVGEEARRDYVTRATAYQVLPVGRYATVCSLSGAVTGFVMGAISAPLELVKVQMMLERIRARENLARLNLMDAAISSQGAKTMSLDMSGERSSWRTACEIVKRRGVRGLYYGFTPHMIRETLGTALYFGGYESMKSTLYHRMGQKHITWVHLLSGGFAGVFCWTFIFPIDLVKSRMQKRVLMLTPGQELVEDRTMSNVVRKIWQRDGLRGFFRGIQVTMTRAFPIHALGFVVYERVLGGIRRWTGLHEEIRLR